MPISKNTTRPALHKQTGLIYGPPKVGKSTLASQIPKALFLATERGLDQLPADRWQNADGQYVITTWDDLLLATKEAVESKYEAIILDTIGNACALCDAYICTKNGEDYKGDGKLGYGKGTALIINELKRYLTKLSAQGLGVWMLAHSTTKTETKRTGNIEKVVPFLPGDNKAGELYNAIVGMVDNVWFIEVPAGGTAPLLHTKPGGTFDAGDRSGRLPTGLATDAHTFETLTKAYAPAAPAAPASTTHTANSKKA